MGHTRILPGYGTVSKYSKSITSARSLVARDALELRRVYQVPNKQIEKLIKMNKDMYPEMNLKK